LGDDIILLSGTLPVVPGTGIDTGTVEQEKKRPQFWCGRQQKTHRFIGVCCSKLKVYFTTTTRGPGLAGEVKLKVILATF
jgi:hypothetical protein